MLILPVVPSRREHIQAEIHINFTDISFFRHYSANDSKTISLTEYRADDKIALVQVYASIV